MVARRIVVGLAATLLVALLVSVAGAAQPGERDRPGANERADAQGTVPALPGQQGPQPEPYGTHDATGFRNILTPGQDGHTGNSPRPPHSSDQRGLYEKLVFEAPTLRPKQLRRFFKDATFGVKPGHVDKRYVPRSDVTIVRDRQFGVPHVYGENRDGAMFGAGYAGAEDRLFVMDVLRHAGRAELSEFLGGSKGNREMDREQWQVAPYKEKDLQAQFDRADELYGAEGRQVQRDVQEYVDGINKYICEAQPTTSGCTPGQSAPTVGSKNEPNKLPAEYNSAFINNPESGNPAEDEPEPWKVTDVIATASLVGGIFGKGGGRELDSALILQSAQRRFGGHRQGRQVWSDFRRAEDPEAPTTINRPFPYLVPDRSPDPKSTAMPDPFSVRKSSPVRDAPITGDGPGFLDGLDELLGASNALVVSGRGSRSGRPLSVFGPQTGYFSPQLLMELDIHAPRARAGPAIDARGATFAGVNLYIQLGRGRDFAWSATSAGQDNVDTFALELCEPDGADPTIRSDHYRYRGRCQRIEDVTRNNRWRTTAACGGCPPGQETLKTGRTKLGLVIARATIARRPVIYVSLRSTYFHEADSALGFADFNSPDRVDSASSYQRAASKIGFTFNWFYADKQDIAYFNSGNNPERPGGIDTNFPVRACPHDGSPGRCEFEWRGWNPDNFTANYTPFSEHPRDVNPGKGYLTSWNNKQAPAYRAADSNFSYGSVHRSEPLDDRIRPRISGGKMDLPELVDAMEDAGTVDLRGDKVLPFLLAALGPQRGELGNAVSKLRAWERSGAHRRDRSDGCKRERTRCRYQHREAIKIMDAWWPRLVDAQFRPVLGGELFTRIVEMMGIDDEPNAAGDHVGSAYIDGWYGYVEKDLRSLLGRPVREPFSRRYCGNGDRARCRDLLHDTLRAATRQTYREVYGRDEVCREPQNERLDDQWCFDAIQHTPAGVIFQPLIHWINRPTFQQAVEVGGIGGGGGEEPTRRDGAPGEEPTRRDGAPGDDVLVGPSGNE